MTPDELTYQNLTKILQPLSAKGRTESATFLNWVLLNIYRLDDIDADDAICDGQNDKGIDGIYVNTNLEEIHFLQSKIRQKDNGTVGDKSLKELIGSVSQFDSAEKISAILESDAHPDLKSILRRNDVAGLVQNGYSLVPVYVTNESADNASEEFEKAHPDLRVLSREVISSLYVDMDEDAAIADSFTFDIGYAGRLQVEVDGGAQNSTLFMFPAKASELIQLNGIQDTSLFAKNVRKSLGSTPVNRSIAKTMADPKQHKNFILFHNGIIVICRKAEVEEDRLTIEGYSVVNGAQSLTTFFNNASKLTDDLRIMVRVIALSDEQLANSITERSNNQNAIKPRDLRSNHSIMTRLQADVAKTFPNHFFEIKRGEKAPGGTQLISNELVGRALLSVDIKEPWGAHQVSRVFDEKFAEIWGRPEVDAHRVVLMRMLLEIVEENLEGIEIRPMANYALTRYFLLHVVTTIMMEAKVAGDLLRSPKENWNSLDDVIARLVDVLKTVVIDLNYEVKQLGDDFDYKSHFKSPRQSGDLRDRLIASYKKDAAREKATVFA